MAQHVQNLAIMHIVYGAFNLVVGACVMLVFFFTSFVIASNGDGGTAVIFALYALFIGAMILVTALPGIIGGIGLLRHHRWARILILIVGALSLMSFPVGAALGVYTFWALLNKETEALFS